VTIVQKSVVSKRRADCTDFEIGQRIRALRLERGLSQTDLGSLIGVTFQQIRKYEMGTNRVSASRLCRLAEVLKAPIASFCFGSTSGNKEIVSSDTGPAYLEATGSDRLVRAYLRVQDPKVRRILVDLVERAARSG